MRCDLILLTALLKVELVIKIDIVEVWDLIAINQLGYIRSSRGQTAYFYEVVAVVFIVFVLLQYNKVCFEVL
jgi:hypothetical protein